MARAQRLSWWYGFTLVLMVVSALSTALGYLGADRLPPLARLALVFMVPMYYLLILTGAVQNRSAALGLACGAALVAVVVFGRQGASNVPPINDITTNLSDPPAFPNDPAGRGRDMSYPAAFVPQAVKTLRTRDTRAISLGMYVVFTVGLCFWLAYGIVLDSWPMILSNVVTLALALLILALKLRHG